MRAALVVFACATLTCFAARADDLQVARPGYYFPGDEPASLDREWLCIGPDGASVRARACHPQLVEDPNDGMGGRELQIREGYETIFLFRDAEGARGPGDVPTYLREEVSFEVGERPVGTHPGARFSVQPRAEGVCIDLLVGSLRQTLACPKALDINGATAVRWAGDLDGDGALDLLLDVSPHAAGTDMRLYLSTRARAGELVGEAARLVKSNC